MRVGRSSSVIAQMCSDELQGSALGPILFTAYVSLIGRLIELYGVSYHKYADNTQLYTALTVNRNACIERLKSYSAGLQRWFCENDHLLNPDKSEVCFVGTLQKPSSIIVAGFCIDVYEKLKTHRPTTVTLCSTARLKSTSKSEITTLLISCASCTGFLFGV